MEQSYSNYTNRILNLRQAKIHGEVIVAKPVLLLALIDGIGQGIFKENRFVLNEWLEDRYLKLMVENTRHSQFNKPAYSQSFLASRHRRLLASSRQKCA